MNVLHITSILPAPLERKKKENDILIRIAKEYQDEYPETKHYFLLILPYSNTILGLISKRWKEYNLLLKKGGYEYGSFNIKVIGIPAFKNDSRFKKDLTYLGYKIFEKKINKWIVDYKPDIIHAHNLKSNLEIAKLLKKKFNINYVVTARNIQQETFNNLKATEFPPRKILSINFQNYKKLKINSNISVQLIPHPVDGDFYLEPSNKISNEINLISICRLLKLKNLDKVILALSKIKENFVYDIYGSGPEEKNLKQLVLNLNLESKVNFKGWVSHHEIKNKMSNYDLFLQPSFPETLGRVYFEAMASGVPVVASFKTGIDGIISSNLEGFLVDHNSLESIHGAIKKYLGMSDKDKYVMKKAAHNRMLDYKWDNVLKKYKEFYTL